MSVGESKVQQFEELCRELANERAVLSLTRGRKETGSDVVAVFTPHNPRAAKIEARLELDFGVYLLLGCGAPFEVPFDGGYYTRGLWLDEVRAFCSAVIGGHFVEKVTTVNGRVRGSDHTLVLQSGKEIAEHWRRGLIAPWSKKEVQVIHYEPY